MNLIEKRVGQARKTKHYTVEQSLQTFSSLNLNLQEIGSALVRLFLFARPKVIEEASIHDFFI